MEALDIHTGRASGSEPTDLGGGVRLAEGCTLEGASGDAREAARDRTVAGADLALHRNNGNLLAPVALGSRSNGRPAKSAIGETDVSCLAPAAAFDMCWIKVLNGRSPSSVTLDASASPRPCRGVVSNASCRCRGMDTPAHLFGDDHVSCPIAVHEPIFRQMVASLWFRYGVPLLGCAPVGSVPLEVSSAVGYRSGFVAAVTVKPARDAIPLVQEATAHECFQVRRDRIEEHQSTTARRADRRLQKLLAWESESPGNLLHMDHYGTAAAGASAAASRSSRPHRRQ